MKGAPTNDEITSLRRAGVAVEQLPGRQGWFCWRNGDGDGTPYATEASAWAAALAALGGRVRFCDLEWDEVADHLEWFRWLGKWMRDEWNDARALETETAIIALPPEKARALALAVRGALARLVLAGRVEGDDDAQMAAAKRIIEFCDGLPVAPSPQYTAAERVEWAGELLVPDEGCSALDGATLTYYERCALRAAAGSGGVWSGMIAANDCAPRAIVTNLLDDGYPASVVLGRVIRLLEEAVS